MKWGDFLLRFLVRRRDRDTISGDLLEEYREDVLPSKGPVAARLWYARQVLSFVSPAAWGLAIGLAAGTLLLLDTAIEPLADDDAGAMIAVLMILSLLWVATSVAAGRRAQRFRDAVTAGLLVGLATMLAIHVAAIVRVNVFLEQIRHREDWINLVSRFRASGFQSLRMYANYEYLSGSPFLLGFGAAAGTVCGLVGGAINGMFRAPSSQPSR